MKNIKLFNIDSERTRYEDGLNYLEPYVSYVEEDNTVHYNKPKFFCKLTLSDNSVVELEGSGELTNSMVSGRYKDTLVSAELGELCTSIGDSSFYQCFSLTSITITNSINNIGDGAFLGCTSLTSITIPDSVTNIGISAFQGCSKLESISIPKGIKEIKYQCFAGCSNLLNVTIPEGVTNISQYAFASCNSLTSITIPSSVISFGFQFISSSNLTEIISHIMNAPSVDDGMFAAVGQNGTLYVPKGSSGYDTWMNDRGNLGYRGWTKVEQ